VFKVLLLKSISPVEVLMNVSPPGEALKTPPGVPVMVGVGSTADWQKLPAE
jgi:hypothetical protein